MTTESLSPASRMVIETSSRPPGERSTSISLTDGPAAAGLAASALARGAGSAARDTRGRGVGRKRRSCGKSRRELCAKRTGLRRRERCGHDRIGKAAVVRFAARFRCRMGGGGGRDLGDGRRRRDFRLSSASRRVVGRRSRGAHAICCGSGSLGSDRRRGRRAVARWNGGREWFRRHGLGLREVCGQSVFAALTR